MQTTSRFQKTIAHVTHVSGRGYWSGRAISLTFLPAEVNRGVVFRRIDLPGRPEISADVNHRRDTPLRTTLVHGGVHVEMVEHVLSALYGMGIDNCVVECDSPEMPGMDGSALAFAIAIERAGVQLQSVRRNTVTITAPIRLGDERQWVMAIPSHDPGFTVRYELDYGPQSTVPVCESTLSIDPISYTREIAPARTFLEEAEAKQLQLKGVAEHVTYRDLIVFGPTGPIDNTLRFEDECSRHKLLDVVGDIALCGFQVQGKIIAHRSGHRLNGLLARELKELGERQQLRLSQNMGPNQTDQEYNNNISRKAA